MRPIQYFQPWSRVCCTREVSAGGGRAENEATYNRIDNVPFTSVHATRVSESIPISNQRCLSTVSTFL